MQDNLQLPNGVPIHMLSFPEQYVATKKSTQASITLMQDVSTQSGLYIENGSTIAYNFMNKEFLRDCEYSLPDPIEFPPNEKLKSVRSWNIKNLSFELFYESSLLRTYWLVGAFRT